MYQAYINDKAIKAKRTGIPIIFNTIGDALYYLEDHYNISVPVEYRAGQLIEHEHTLQGLKMTDYFTVREVTKIS